MTTDSKQETVTLSSKGQVVIPKALRERLHLREGISLRVTQRDGGVFLEPVAPKSGVLPNWTPINPFNIHLTTEELCRPVDLREEGRLLPLSSKAASKRRSR